MKRLIVQISIVLSFILVAVLYALVVSADQPAKSEPITFIGMVVSDVQYVFGDDSPDYCTVIVESDLNRDRFYFRAMERGKFFDLVCQKLHKWDKVQVTYLLTDGRAYTDKWELVSLQRVSYFRNYMDGT